MDATDGFIVFFVSVVFFLMVISGIIVYKRERSDDIYRDLSENEPRDYN